MKKYRSFRISIATSILCLTAWCATKAPAASSLVAIPLLGSAANNWGLAITPDGLWVGGYSDDSSIGGNPTPGFLYNVTAGTAATAFNTKQVLNPVSGVCYRTSGGQQQVVVGGLAAAWDSDLMTTNGTNFSSVRRYTYDGSGQKPVQWITNMRAAGGGDAYFDVWWDTQSLGQLFIGKFSGAWDGTLVPVLTPTPGLWDTYSVGSGVEARAVSGTGRAVGTLGGSPRANYVWDWTGTGTVVEWQFNGLAGVTDGEAFAISADGQTVFGRSPSSDSFNRPGTWPYKATFDTTMPGAATQLSVNELPSFPDTAGSDSLGVPYGCTADGKYAVGFSYRYMERAVLWDASDPNPAKWTVLDLTDFATAQGILGNFTLLNRAYNVGENAGGNIVITGIGGDAGGFTRAFVLTVPKPLSAYSVWPATLSISNTPTKYTFRFNSIASSPNDPAPLTNYFEYTPALSNAPDLSTWTALVATQCVQGLTTLVDPNPPDQTRFYRIRTQ
jgi:hypothetical protein